MTADLFAGQAEIELLEERLAPGAVVLRGYALREEAALCAAVQEVIGEAPLRHMVTPGGFRMSVAMTNCGALGWVTEETGYRYDPIDPQSGRSWPQLPVSFMKLAHGAP
jgi:alkylated DNA repair protein (DNA oxidative demethylase)